MRTNHILAALLLAALLPTTGADAQSTPKSWQTTGDGKQRLRPAPIERAPSSARATITVDATRRYQTMVGFGASITDASAILIQKLPPARRDALIRELFGRANGGLGLDFTRLTIGASDFSPTHYSFDDMPAGGRDPNLDHFSIAPNRADVLPTIRQALRVNPRLLVMASPWSPPGWMKTGGSMIGGTLRPDSYDAYARYFVHYLQAYRAEGVPIRYVTIQNEPDFSPDSYPGMKWPAIDRARFVGRNLGPALEAAKLPTRVLEWDHNWDQPQQPESVLSDPVAARYIDGVAWHCYGGDVSAQSRVRERFPSKDVYFTECSGGGWRPGWKTGFSDTVRGLMIGATRNWARGVLLWNLALDPSGGPHKGGCGNCRGVVTIDPATGTITRELEYYALGHLSRFVRRGAIRIEATATPELPAVAFQNLDGEKVLLVFNSTTTPAVITMADGSTRWRFTLPAVSARTVIWR